MKKVITVILVLAMILGIIPVLGQNVYAAEKESKITLGNIAWNQEQTEYHFPNAQAVFAGGRAQRLFCLSVNDGGSFRVAEGFRFQGNRRTIRGVQRNEDGSLEYISLVEDGQGEGISGKELTSITVRGMDITNTQIETFLRGLTFKRNGASESTVQEITVIANEMDLDDEEVAMASDGTIHYYKYVKFDDEEEPEQERATWYDAYNEAKQTKFAGMKGYLATLTDANEELYIYGAFGGGIQAWIGGARTHTGGFLFDEDTIADDALNPGGLRVDGTDTGLVARNWYWVCGPEAGTAFYRTNTQGNTYWGDGENSYGPVGNSYHDWNRDEPNNNPNQTDSRATYKAEYALEYGYEGANWNDYSPYNVTRTGYGMSGYIVEFSPYTMPEKEGVNPTVVAEDVPSVTEIKEVSVSGGVDDIRLTAYDFTVAAGSEVLTPESLKEKAEADARDAEGNPVYPIEVNEQDLEKLNQAIQDEKTGKYPVEITAGNKKIIIIVTVTDNGTDPTPTGEPGATKDPSATAEPGATKNPSATAEPGATKDPSATAEPGATKDPSASGEPAVTKDPTVTGKPGATKDPYLNIVDESGLSGDDLNKRDDLPLLLAKGIGGHKKISLTWLNYKGATKYEVYWSYCNGKKSYKKLATTAKRKATHKKLSYKKSYKYFVVAYRMYGNKKVYLAKSPQIHVAMKKDKRTNARKVTVKKATVTLKPKKTFTIKASIQKENKKKKLLQHAVKFRYYTDDYRVATVNKKGRMKAVSAGKCNIYVIANNGVYKKIKVTVKK